MNIRRIGLVIFVTALLGTFLCAQAHVYRQSYSPATPEHDCPICMCGVWAIPASTPSLSAPVLAFRLEIAPPVISPCVDAPLGLPSRAPPVA